MTVLTGIGRAPTDEDRAFWVGIAEEVRAHPDLLPYIEQEDRQVYNFIVDGLHTLAIEARSEEWRDPDPEVGGRPNQLIPGTAGSFSARVDWALYLLMGGRGSGKSRTGAEGTRELLQGRRWIEPPRWALVGQTLDSVRIDMVENTLFEVLPPGSVYQWNRGPCELWVWVPAAGRGNPSKPGYHLAYLKGYSSETPRKLRGPNFHGGWFDELATWKDADRSPQANDTTYYTAMLAMRAHDRHTWTPRVIGTTTPKAVRLLRNPLPNDPMNPGPGLVDDKGTVVSSMSTLDNVANLSDHYVDRVIRPLEGTRLYRQEVEGELIGATLGALWSPELVESMLMLPEAGLQPDTKMRTLGGGLQRVVVGVDPSIGGGEGDECGIVAAGLGWDHVGYVLEDASLRGPASAWCREVQRMALKWGAECVVVEANQGGELVSETMGRYAPNLPITEVWAKRGKLLRAEPVALLSDQGRVRLVGDFPLLTLQMQTYVGAKPGSGAAVEDSPDRLDAFVYSLLELIPPGEGLDELLSVNRGRNRR